VSSDLNNMIYQANLKKADECFALAEKNYNDSNDESASRYYEKAANAYSEVAKMAPAGLVKIWREKSKDCRVKADFLKSGQVPKDRGASAPPSSGQTSATKTKRKGDESEKGEDDKQLSEAVSGLLHNSSITFDQIGGLAETKREIKYALGVSLAQKGDIHLESWKNWLFYGPPGTGKTLLAAATSNLLKSASDTKDSAVFFNVKVSSVMSKYFGESTRIISQLYESARYKSPAVVFLDEFESICGARDGGDSGTERRILSTILAELDGLAEKGRDDLFVLTIAATNRPWDLDPAVLSRFDKKILIPLPDPDTRRAILKLTILDRGYDTEFTELDSLVELTEGLSGREIDRLVKEVTNQMVMERNAEIVTLVDRGLEHVRNYEVKSRPLTLKDFREASQRVHPVTSTEEMKKYKDWKDSDDE
jgi:katanin p60 ATPase-containing subunit A1